MANSETNSLIIALSIITFLCSFLNAIDAGGKTQISSNDAIVYYRLLQLALNQEPIIDRNQLSKSVVCDHPEVDIPATLERLQKKRLISLYDASIIVNKTIEITVTDS